MELEFLRAVNKARRSSDLICRWGFGSAVLKLISVAADHFKMPQCFVQWVAQLGGAGLLVSALYAVHSVYCVTQTPAAQVRGIVAATAATIERMSTVVLSAISAHSQDPICLGMVLGAGAIYAASYAVTQIYDPAARRAGQAVREHGLF